MGAAQSLIDKAVKKGVIHKKTAARTAGANGWIQKPFNPQRLVNAVDKTLAKI